jgi:hypothetical protein
MVALAAAHAGAQDEQQRPDALAAAEQDMASHLGDQGDMRLEIGCQRRVNGGDVFLQILENTFFRGSHVNKVTYLSWEVNRLGERGEASREQ